MERIKRRHILSLRLPSTFFSLVPILPSFPLPPPILKNPKPNKKTNQQKKKKVHNTTNYGGTSILIGPDVKIDATTEGVVVLPLLLGLGGVVGRGRGVGGVGVVIIVVAAVKIERGQNDVRVDDVVEKVVVVKVLSFSKGGVEGADEDGIVVVVVVGSVNVKGEGGGG